MESQKKTEEQDLLKVFIPTNGRILIKQKEEEEATETGLYIPENDRERPRLGIVVAVAEEVAELGQFKTGDVVLYGQHAGVRLDFKIGTSRRASQYAEHWLMHFEEIHGKIPGDIKWS